MFLQETILWDIDTNLEILKSEKKAEGERHQILNNAVAKLIEEVGAHSRSIGLLNAEIEKLAADRHPPGFYEETVCKANCHAHLLEFKADTKKLIDSRIDSEKLKQIGF